MNDIKRFLPPDDAVNDYIKITSRDISAVSGIGVKRREAFARLGIFTVGELLRHFPRAYQNRGNIRLLSDAVIGENCSYLLTVGTQPRTALLKNRMTLTKFTAFDDSGTVVINYFNSRYMEKAFRVGETFRFWGRVTSDRGRLMMSSPIKERFIGGVPLPDVVPVYPSSAGLTQKIISDAITDAISMLEKCGVPETLPKEFRDRLGLPPAYTALRNIHRSGKLADLELARRYFAAEEAYIFALGLSLTKSRKRSGTPPEMKTCDLSRFLPLLGFPLTNAQNRSVKEIASDMVSAKQPMSRLLSGDVGSGKTAVCAAAMYIAAENGFQSALMAPTEILAVQHYESLSPLFEKLGFRTALLTGSTPVTQKRDIKASLADGSTDIVIGTHALITPDTEFSRLGLVVTDEQHRFGVSQRARLGGVGKITPHVLVMSATPIPRTLSLILYGELSASMLDELPPGRQKTDTYVVDESYRDRLNSFIRRQVSDGGQVYVVCPAVEDSPTDEDGDLISFAPDGSAELQFDRPPLKSAVGWSEKLKNDIFPDLSVGLVHGKMKGRDKADIMRRFADGKIDILVSTTVIEVGVNVPNASLMIIENAERFGLAQLHQLRGRVGRGKRKAYCVLVSDAKGETAKKRLSVMKSTSDGYRIAEYDLELRGPGDYFPSGNGTARQHGSFAIAVADMGLLRDAMSEAEKVLAADPSLSSSENLIAAGKLRELFSADERAMQ